MPRLPPPPFLLATELLSYITTATFGKNTWNGTTTSFVLHWEEQVRLYERYVPPTSHLGTELKRTLLQNAVNGITDLRQVKLNADQLVQAQHTHTGLSYLQYRIIWLWPQTVLGHLSPLHPQHCIT